MAGENHIPVEFCDRKKLDKLAATSDNQGIVALRQPFVYQDLDELIKNRNPSSAYDLILVLDSIIDPQNLGSIIRSAHCWGANGVVIPEDRSANVTAAVNKASAGSVPADSRGPGCQSGPVARISERQGILGFRCGNSRGQTFGGNGFSVLRCFGHGKRGERNQASGQEEMRLSGHHSASRSF